MKTDIVKLFKDYNTDEVIEVLFVDFFNDNNVIDLKKLDHIHEIAFGKKLKDALTKLIAFDIITEENNVLSLTKEGHKVVQLGSWKAYLKRQDNWFLKDNWNNTKWVIGITLTLAGLIIAILKL
jgi:hypothetical protein